MKIKSKFLFPTLLFCFLSLVSTAMNPSGFSVKMVDKNSFVLQLPYAKKAAIQVVLKNEQGKILFEETLKQNSLMQRKYNIKQFPSGEYTLTVAYDIYLKVQAIKKEKESLVIDFENLKTLYQPSFRYHADYLDLNMLCLDGLEISLDITDAAGNRIYSEVVAPDRTLEKRFNLSQLPSGSYTLRLKVLNMEIDKEYQEYIEWSPSLAAL